MIEGNGAPVIGVDFSAHLKANAERARSQSAKMKNEARALFLSIPDLEAAIRREELSTIPRLTA